MYIRFAEKILFFPDCAEKSGLVKFVGFCIDECVLRNKYFNVIRFNTYGPWQDKCPTLFHQTSEIKDLN